MAKNATATKARQSAEPQFAQAQGQPPATTENKHPLAKLREQLETRMPDLRRALPPHITPERFVSVTLTAVQNNTDLLAADRASLWNSCMRAAQDGLLPDGREGAIVIYNTKLRVPGQQDRWIKKAQWMPMLAGVLKKIRNSGELASIAARVVYGGDKFRTWIDDSGEHVEYEAAEHQDRSIIRRVFAMARTKDGELFVETLTPEEIDRIRSASRSKDKGPWVDWWDQMAIKSAIRRLSKRLPMSSDIDQMIRRDDEFYELEPGTAIAAPPAAARITSTRAAFDHFAGGGHAEAGGDQPAGEQGNRGPGPHDPGTDQAGGDQEADRGEDQVGGGDAEDRGEGEPDQGGEATDTADEGDQPDLLGGGDAGDQGDAKDGPWPKGRKPTNEAEYRRYAEAQIAEAGNADLLPAWWRGDDERKLRNVCKVGKEAFDALQAAVKERVTAIRKGS